METKLHFKMETLFFFFFLPQAWLGLAHLLGHENHFLQINFLKTQLSQPFKPGG